MPKTILVIAALIAAAGITTYAVSSGVTATPSSTPTTASASSVTHTCPMCGGDFAQPGSCPKCGMALTPKGKDSSTRPAKDGC